MNVTPADLADRYTILDLKRSHLKPCPVEVLKEYGGYLLEIIQQPIPAGMISQLMVVNTAIWNLEHAIRQGQLANPITEAEFAEIGRRAIAIRDLNAKRIAIKNEITKVCGGFIEVKGQHASEVRSETAHAFSDVHNLQPPSA